MLPPGHRYGIEAATDVKALDGWERKHCLGQVSLKPVEHRVTESGRHSAGHTGHDAAQRISVASRRFDGRFDGLGRLWVGAAGGVGVDCIRGDRGRVHVRAEVVDAADPGNHFDPTGLRQEAPCDGTGGHPTDCLAGTGPTAALPVTDPVLGLVAEVGMGRSVDLFEVLVRFWSGVSVTDQHGNWTTQSASFEHSGEDLRLVGLVALGGQVALAGSTAVEVPLEVLDPEWEAWRAAVDDHAYPATVTLTPRGDAEDRTERTAHVGRA